MSFQKIRKYKNRFFIYHQFRTFYSVTKPCDLDFMGVSGYFSASNPSFFWSGPPLFPQPFFEMEAQ